MMDKPTSIAQECKHVGYSVANDGKDDLTIVKIKHHLSDGTYRNEVKFIKNYKRNFWITKPQFRNHEAKKEWEQLKKLQKFTCPTVQIAKIAAGQLGFNPKANLRQISNSQYLYGTDIGNGPIIKHKFRTKFPDAITPHTVAVLDFETDMIEDTDHYAGSGYPITSSLTMGSKVFVAYTKRWLDGYPNIEKKLYELAHEHLPDLMEERDIQLEVVECKDALDLVTRSIQKVHEYSPEYLTFWNSNFDMLKCIEAIEDFGGSPEDIFSDPRVPKRFRSFRYVEASAEKKMASGKSIQQQPSELWHRAFFPATWKVIDAMAAYRTIRISKGKDTNYSLDAILKKHGIGGKLKFDVGKNLTVSKWHQYMQASCKPEYLLYNIYDCVSVEMLLEETGDISATVPLNLEYSDVESFKSNPRRLVDDLHFFCLDEGHAIAATGYSMEEDTDKYLSDKSEWIVTLPPHLTRDIGLPIIEDIPTLLTFIVGHVYDLDVKASYPSSGVFLNISKETTYIELSKIKGYNERTKRKFGLDLTGGHVNATTLAQEFLGFPDFDTLLEEFEGAEAQL